MDKVQVKSSGINFESRVQELSSSQEFRRDCFFSTPALYILFLLAGNLMFKVDSKFTAVS
eukprot:snap_masked-scaffold_3-processed-gene-19.31-mRNA-1 protein AED:1.00 eAED:1.00 QI:0/0/0/0/1/1/2/0/59